MIILDKTQLKELVNKNIAKGSEHSLAEITRDVRLALGLPNDKSNEVERLIHTNLSLDSDYSFMMKKSKSRPTEEGLVKVFNEMRIRRN